MKLFLFSFKMAIKLQGRHKKSGSVGLAETKLFFSALYMKNGLVHHYHLGESTVILGTSGVILNFKLVFRCISLTRHVLS